MSFALSAPLQRAVYQHLVADAPLNALVGTAIFDAMPAGQMPPLYVSLGGETTQDRSDVTGQGSLHRLTISVVSQAAGFSSAKDVAGAICDALVGADLTLSRGRLVFLNFERAVARRTGSAGDLRQIDLRFRARVDDVNP
jgi:hypothetical protein